MTTAGPAKIRSLRSTLASAATMMDGAIACASAAESGRRPSDRALRAVGIDARHWDRIGTR
ncbi:hypothetical protein [Aureimonas psammosilenae]|jgi:hypothetical protein|uniref:hypothetical protein n=1 Tax=Aureimonas psammosilenae TaxID=2495496 RepID=UPI0012607559|nr:hypothetical protein [Aureimonas psammosilenae]